MRRTIPIVLIALLVATAWLVWPRDEPQRARGPDGIGPSAAAPTIRPPETGNRAPDPAPDPATSSPSRVEAPQRAEVEEPDPDPDPDPDLAEIRGRFRLPGGAPAAGVTLGVHGWGGNTERVMKYGEPADWVDPAGVSGDDGSFSLRFAPPRAFQFTLDANHSGFAEESWRWGEILPAAVVDIGEVVLRPAGRIRGRVVNEAGEALIGFRIYADSRAPKGDGRDETRGAAQVDETTREFVIEGMPAGPATLRAYSRMTNWIDGPEVIVTVGEEVEAEISYLGPDNSRRITVVTFVRPIWTEDVESETIRLRGNGPDRTATHIPGSSQSESFEDLPPGTYVVEIDDPRFLPWRREGVRPGTSVDAVLTGSAAIVLTCRDGRRGEPVEPGRVRVELRSSRSRPNVFDLLEEGAAPPEGGRFAGLVPGDYRVFVRAAGLAEAWVDVDGLLAGETRAVAIELFPAARVRGIVVSGGDPVSGATVALFESAESAEADTRRGFRGSAALQEVTSDDGGAFELADLPPGSFSITARYGPLLASKPTSLEVSAGRDVERVRLELPPAGRFVGAVGEWAKGIDGLRLVFQPIDPGPDDEDLWFLDEDALNAPIDASGRFVSELLPHGTYEAALSLSGAMVEDVEGFSMWLDGPRIALGRQVLDRREVPLDLLPASPFGALRVRVVEAGRPAASHSVRVVSRGAADGNAVGVLAETGTDGWATVASLPPGEYDVGATRLGARWTAMYAAPVHVAAGATSEAVIAIELHPHGLAIVDDETGEPPPNEGLYLAVRCGSLWSNHRISLDDAGKVELALPVGPVTVQQWSPERGRRTGTVEWTTAGPVPPVLRLREG